MSDLNTYDASCCVMCEYDPFEVFVESVCNYFETKKQEVEAQAKMAMEKAIVVKNNFVEAVKTNIMSSPVTPINVEQDIEDENQIFMEMLENHTDRTQMELQAFASLEEATRGSEPRMTFDPSCCVLQEQFHVMTKAEQEQAKIEMEQMENGEFEPSVEQAIIHYQMGIQPAFDYVYKQFEGQMEQDAAKNAPSDIHKDEVFELEIEQFVICANTYKGGMKFKTYLWNCIQHKKAQYYSSQNAKKRTSESKTPDMSLSDQYGDTEMSVLDTISDEKANNPEKSIVLRTVIEDNIKPNLSEKNLELFNIMDALFADGVKKLPMEKIAEKLGISRAGLHNRRKKLFEEIRKNFTREQFAELLYA